MDNWGFKIKELRKGQHWTQQELARRSGIDRGYIAKIEIGLVKSPTQNTFGALASAFGMTLDELQGAITGVRLKTRSESPEQILERLRLAQPVRLPVYDYYHTHAGEGVEPVDYVYLPRTEVAGKNIEACIVHGECLSPVIEENDVIIVDRDASIDVGDIVVCLFFGEFHLGRLKKIADELYLDSRQGQLKIQDCQLAAKVIQVIKRLG